MKIFKSTFSAFLALAALFFTNLTFAADAAMSAVTPASAVAAAAAPAEVPVNWHAVVMFLIFVAVTLVITYWAATRTKTATDFYAAGRGITGLQNGMAIAGDYMSAASFLGIAALVYMNGFYGLIFSVGWLVGWPIILFLIAERLRNLGKYTYGDVVSFRLSQGPVRTMAAIGSLIVVIWYLIGQAVGAGQLLHTLVPQISYRESIVVVGALIIIYVTFGGMKATTWVQIIKAGLLLGGATLMAIGVMSHEGFSFAKLFNDAVAAHPKHLDIMKSVVPLGAKANPIESISLGLTLMLGTAGLPHILMRFFTVTDSKAARKSVLYGTCFIGFFYVLTFIIGFGAIVLVANNPEYVENVTKSVLALKGGGSMPAVYLSHALGGDLFLGFIAAVAFATILAVVSGLTLAGASALSHDIYARVIMKGNATEKQEVWVSKLSVIGLGILAIILGIAFEKQNVAYIVALTFSIAACTNFPILALSIFWRGLTTRGAVVGGYTGIFGSIGLLIIGPTVWTKVLGMGPAIFPYDFPTFVVLPAVLIVAYIVSKTDSSESGAKERAAYDAQMVRAETGLGAEVGASH
ncbi:cation/acetate symporter ActP [Sideroxydans lithotrophicus]|uniref:Cation/acetate symporter ActP n=1 Tax=Sideroxydans lithotrophicus (strain ES-1) TaxID=580332 RepID=D5CN29_SIDLE|nr:cation/acetate symporter ActP [Sideroxydans lithotrophicus]ADE12726.1 SSS sodium solute transporter superfamily [Sideroxydans lithotrophicus ES-1]